MGVNIKNLQGFDFILNKHLNDDQACFLKFSLSLSSDPVLYEFVRISLKGSSSGSKFLDRCL